MLIFKPMKQHTLTLAVLVLFTIGLSFLLYNNNETIELKTKVPSKIRSSYSPKAVAQASAGRDSYFFNMLRDPALNKIPNGIRSRELAFYASLPKESLKSGNTEYTWSEAGPNDVGGRTRALCVDNRNSNIVIAGGVSGGIWKSTDKGQSWQLKNSPNETYSVTSICQDTRSGQENTWYYASGEFSGNSADGTESSLSGYGIYKSTDNGETWSLIYGGVENNPFDWDNYTDYISKIKVNPNNGEVLFAAHAHGIMKIYEDAGSYKLTGEIGGLYDYIYSDFDIDAQGNILAVLSEDSYNTDAPAKAPGVYYKAHNQPTYSQIDASSSTFPTTHQRSVIRIAPSDATIGYVFTHKGGGNVSFHKIDLSNNSLIDRTGNLPAFDDSQGKLGPQANYNMTLAIKPNDANFVIIGNTSLFRSNDGFATSVEKDYSWIGGYSSNSSFGQYPNHHADCHISVFDPINKNALWSGHDGGLSYVSDITQNTTSSTFMPWEDKNNGYNVTQYYTIADINIANDDRYIGGTQDNGTPGFTFNETTSSSKLIGSGDGSYCYLGENYAYVSSQNGRVIRTGYNAQNFPLSPYVSGENSNWSNIDPTDATGQLFINPFVINPNNEQVMYYAAGEKIWINKAIETIPNFESKTMQGWSAPAGLDVPSGYTVTSMSISKNPAHIFYYAAYSTSEVPLIYKVANSTANEASLTRTNISIPEASSGSYPHNIAINPQDANEIIIVFSNYNVPSIFHSIDGGLNYIQIDGNLSYSVVETDPSVSDVSIRSASILNWEGKKTYFISTSIGLYKTQLLDGAETVWANTAPEKLGNVVCNMVKTCDLDGKVVAATHGRGIFVGKPSVGTSTNSNLKDNPLNLGVYPNPSNGTFKVSIRSVVSDHFAISIFDTNGRSISKQTFSSLVELNNYQFNLTNEPTGIYIIKLYTNNQVYSQKINIR